MPMTCLGALFSFQGSFLLSQPARQTRGQGRGEDAAEQARKPDYYAGITDPDIEDRKQAALQREKEEWLDLCSRPNRLIVYGQEPETCRRKSAQLRAEMQEIRARFPPKAQP